VTLGAGIFPALLFFEVPMTAFKNVWTDRELERWIRRACAS
jgi:hypothetical protein